MASNEIHLLMVLDAGLLQNGYHKQQITHGTCLGMLLTVLFSRNLILLRSVLMRSTPHRSWSMINTCKKGAIGYYP